MFLQLVVILRNFQKFWAWLSYIRKLLKLTLILITWRIWWAPNVASRWKMGFNTEFKGLRMLKLQLYENETLEHVY